MTKLTENLFAVEVPEGKPVIMEDDILKVGELKNVTYLTPPGSWQLLCTTKEASEEQAKGIVEKVWGGYKHYWKDEGFVPRGFNSVYDTASASLRSLLTSKGMDGNKNYVLLKKGNYPQRNRHL